MGNCKNKLIAVFLIVMLIFTQNTTVLAQEQVGDYLWNHMEALLGNIKKLSVVQTEDITKKQNQKQEKIKEYAKQISQKQQKVKDKIQDTAKQINELKDKKMQTPVITRIDTIKNSINAVRWNKVPGAVGYELDADGRLIEIGNKNEYINKNLATNSSHKYRVRAIGRSSVSEWSSIQCKNVQQNNLKGIFNPLSIETTQTVATAVNTVNAVTAEDAENPAPQVEAQIKVSDPGAHNGVEWVEAGGDAISGVYIEAIKAKLINVPSGMSIKYQVYVNGSWQEWKSDWQETDIVPGQYVQKVKMMISGGDERYSIQYSLGSTTYPYSPIVMDGQESGKYGDNAEGFYVNLFDSTKYKEIDINQDTTWGPGLNIIDGYVKVSYNATLTISPGAIIQFNKDSSDISGMEVDGKVIAQGTSAQPIIFKSAGTDMLDDYEFRSITINKDGEFSGNYINESVQDIGSNGFLVYGKFSLSNSQVIDPGMAKLSNGIIVHSDEDVSIENSTISNFVNGISLSGSGNFTIDRNDIFNNYDGISIDNETVTTCANIMIGHEYTADDTQKQKIHDNDTGIEVFDGWNEHDRITIDSNIVDKNESYGLHIGATCAGPFRIEANEFTNNALTKSEFYGPIFINLGGLVNHDSDIFNIFNAINPNDSSKNNQVTNNGYDAVVLYGTASSSITLPKGNLKYLAVNVNIPSGQSFDIKPGVVMNIMGYLNVWGQLRACGVDDSGNKQAVILCQVDNSSYGIRHTSKGAAQDQKEKYFDDILIGDKGIFSGNNVKVIGGGANTALGSIANFGNLILSDSEVLQPYFNSIMNDGKSVLVNVNINNNFNYKNLNKEDAQITDAIENTGDITLINSKISNAYNGLSSISGKNLIIGTTFDSNSAAINTDNETDVFNSKITNSGCCAVIIDVGGENSKFNNNSFINNGQTLPYGDHPESASFINLISPSMIDARGNYWGAATGPRVYDYLNKKWIGDPNADSVDTYIDISGYLAQEPKPVDLGSNFSKYIKSVQYVTQMHFGEKGINPGSGNYCRTYTDMNISFSGIDLKLGRTYNSKDDKSNNMGRGWRFNFQGKIEDYNDDEGKPAAKMAYLPDGSVQVFTSGENGYEPQNSRSKLTKQADGTFILVTKDQTSYGFNKDGILYWIRDKYGNYITLIIDSNKNVSRILDPRGRYFQINYRSVGGNNNLIDSITEYIYDPTYDASSTPPKIIQYFKTGRTIKYNYDENNMLESAADALGNITEHYVYDDKGYLSKILNENKEIKESVSYYHDDDKNKDRVKQVTDPFGNTQNYSYDYDFGRTIITDPQGKQNEQWYDKQMYTYMVVNPDKKFTYTMYNTENGVNKYGEQKYVYDRNGNATKYDRDSSGNVTRKTNPDSSFIQYQYDDQNNVIKEINETGKVTYNVYDTVYKGSFTPYAFYPYALPSDSVPAYNIKSKILVKKAQPLNGKDEYTAGCDESKFAITRYSYYGDDESSQNNYRVKGLIKSVTDPRGNTNTYTYDNNGNPVTITNEEGKVTKYQYNNFGFKDWSISPSGYKTQYNYDMNGNLLRTILHGGETTRTVYDIEGRKVKEISANLYKASADNLTDNSYSEYKGTRYTYYPYGKVHTLLDAGNNLTSYTYDFYGNVKTETKPDNSIYTYEYDDANRIKRVRFQENINSPYQVLEEYDYEIITRQVDSGDSSKTAEILTKRTARQYTDDKNYLTTVCIYDYANRVIEQDDADGNAASTVYNGDGTKGSTTDGNGNTTYYKYDSLNRLNEKWIPFSRNNTTVTYVYYSYDYDNDGNKLHDKVGLEPVELWQIPQNFATKSYSYYKDNKLHTETDNEGRKNEYDYDDDGNLSEEVKNVSDKEQRTVTYTNNYFGKPDHKYSFVAGKDIYGHGMDDETQVTLQNDYSYDKDGNLKTEKAPDNTVTEYFYDDLDRQTGTSVKPETGTAINIETKTLDWKGNPITVTDADSNTTKYEYGKRGELLRTEDPRGGITLFKYDLAGRKIASVLPDDYIQGADISQMDRNEYVYDGAGRIVLEKDIYLDPDTNQWVTNVIKANKYDGNGNLVKELDALGYIAGSGSNFTEKIDTGYGTEYTYNLINKVTAKLDPCSKEKNLSYTSKYEYDTMGRVSSELSAMGGLFQYSYNNLGKITSKIYTDPVSNAKTVLEDNAYDLLGNLVEASDSKGNKIIYQYNTFDKLRKAIYPGDSTMPEYIIDYQYDKAGNLIKQQDSKNKLKLYSYDSFGRQISSTESGTDGSDPINITCQYDLNGNKIYEVDGNGNITYTTYDKMNLPLTITSKVKNENGTYTDHTKKISYDNNNNVMAETDWLNNAVSSSYDHDNRLIEKKNQLGNVIQNNKYYENGLLKESADANNHTTSYYYDKDNRLIKTINPENKAVSKTYDENGNISTKTDGNNNTTTYVYNALNQLEKIIDPQKTVTSYTYDSNGNKMTQTDGNNHTIIFEYNVCNKLVKKIDNGGRTGTPGSYAYDNSKIESYKYNADGSLYSKTSRNGITTVYTYDIHQRLVNQVTSNISISYTYDKNGNQLTVSDSTGTTVRTYDELNRVTSKSVPDIGRTSFLYDIPDGKGGWYEKTTDPKGNISTKEFDRAGRLSAVFDGSDMKNAAQYEYYNDGSKKRVVYANGASEEYYYYNDNTLKSMTNKKPDSSVLESYNYSYDNANNLCVKTDSQGTTIYQYDELNRVEKIKEAAGTTEYTYDGAGNRYTEKYTYSDSSKGYIFTKYNYNDQNRLTGTEKKLNGSLIIEKKDYTYDNNGNQLSEKTTAYSYDNSDPDIPSQPTLPIPKPTFPNLPAPKPPIHGTPIDPPGPILVSSRYGTDEITAVKTNGVPVIAATSVSTVTNEYDCINRLVKTNASNGYTVSNTYNGEGIRISKQTLDNKNTIIDYEKYLYEGDKIILQEDSAGNQTARNIYGTNLISRIQPGNNNSGDVTAYYLFNGHGDVIKLVDSAGNILNSYYYDAFGKITQKSENVKNPFTYAGYQYDSETDTYYLMCRMYNPSSGRFLQEDTYSGEPDDPLSLNLYTYCQNNPLIYTDSTGHFLDKLFSAASDIWNTVCEYADDVYEGICGIASNVSSTISDMYENTVEFWADPVKGYSEFNDEIVKPFIKNDLGIESDSMLYYGIKYVGVRGEGLLCVGTDIDKGIAKSVKGIIGAGADAGDVILKSIGNDMGLIDDKTLQESTNRLLNDARALTAIPQNLVDGFKNDISTVTDENKIVNFLFNPNASLQDVYTYESSTVNIAMGIDGAADLVGAAGSLGRKAFQAVSKSFAEDSVGAAEKTFNVLGKGNIAEDIANESGGRLALPEPKKMLALPAPEERLALPAPEERLALPAPEERLALPAPKEVSNPVTNSKGIPYPEVTDLKTGKPMEFPNGELIRVPKDERVGWYRNQSEADLYRENDTDILCKEDFIDEWYRRGYSDPPLDWKKYDIHHITPREFGGDSSFENLTPIEREAHQSEVTPWWNAYDK